MYKSNVNKRPFPSTSKEPVYVSKKKNLEKIQEKENEAANRDVPNTQSDDFVVQSSQGPNEATQATQSRFLSQRHQFRPTQQFSTQLRGKNYFETALFSSKIKVTDLGKKLELSKCYEIIIEFLLGCELVNENDDPVSFSRRFRSLIGNSTENPAKFIHGFKESFNLSDPESLKNAQKFLSGMIIKDAHQNHQSQTSLIQCFFAVASLRDEITKILLENLKKYVIEK